MKNWRRIVSHIMIVISSEPAAASTINSLRRSEKPPDFDAARSQSALTSGGLSLRRKRLLFKIGIGLLEMTVKLFAITYIVPGIDCINKLLCYDGIENNWM